MEEIRKNHNDAKYHILDVGCGFGGDLQKWHKCGANINMCDPVPEALEEARSRAKNMHMRVTSTSVQTESLMLYVSTFHFTTSLPPRNFSSVRYVKSRRE